MRSFEIVRSSTDTLTSHSGLALVGRGIARTNLARDLDTIALRHGIAHSDCVISYVALLATGKSDFDAIESRRDDAFFKEVLDITKVPSAPSLRQRFDEHAAAMIGHVDKASIDFLLAVGAPITPIVLKHGTALRSDKVKYVVLDMDVFPMDNSGTKKEGVSYTYKGFDGYAPLAAYLGEEGWCLACELRPGSQHGQKEFIYFAERVVARAKQLTPLLLLVRLDSGHDAIENRFWFASQGHTDVIIKWNPRRQDLAAWLKLAEEKGVWQRPREGKRVGIFSVFVEEEHGGVTREFRRVMRVTERTIDKHGNPPGDHGRGLVDIARRDRVRGREDHRALLRPCNVGAVPFRVQDRPRHRAAAVGEIRHQRSGDGERSAGLQHPALDRARRIAARGCAGPA